MDNKAMSTSHPSESEFKFKSFNKCIPIRSSVPITSNCNPVYFLFASQSFLCVSSPLAIQILAAKSGPLIPRRHSNASSSQPTLQFLKPVQSSDSSPRLFPLGRLAYWSFLQQHDPNLVALSHVRNSEPPHLHASTKTSSSPNTP
jgi:hypothetical protein